MNKLPEELNKRFWYLKDLKNFWQPDQWRIMDRNDEGYYRGDCEDYALTALYHLEDKSLSKFWKALIFGDARILFCRVSGTGHAVLRYKGKYIDNIQRTWVTKRFLEDDGYEFKWWYGYIFPTVALKMFVGKISKMIRKPGQTK